MDHLNFISMVHCLKLKKHCAMHVYNIYNYISAPYLGVGSLRGHISYRVGVACQRVDARLGPHVPDLHNKHNPTH